ncbi:CBS domain-containing protein [Desulfotalea psychrophila]|uniref:Related to poly(A) polymerase n=1 Tax=Desulfotalea psychrophila (strain LSv54 / DSM 12343) TaxID=177439 RepID=Q6ASD5_DESPS|nr:CBS domain-containing protein [Desulfotalea psychrophila]CAG34790.1 related to poly(A) polymerase [Desulfotalea psychrophila LSv54]
MHIITTHQNADFDGLASMIAAQKLYPSAILVFPGSREESLHEFIAQNISCNYDFQTADSIELADVRRLTIVDCQSSDKIGRIAECLQNQDLRLDIYDHHSQGRGDLRGDSDHNRIYGACTTVFTRLFQEQKTSISPEEATIFALGIYGNTQSMTRSQTRAEDLYAAGWLVAQGAKLHVISHFLGGALGIAQDEILHELKQEADLFTIKKFPVTIASLSRPQYINDFGLIVKRFYEMENLDAIFVLLATENRIHLTAISRITDIDVGLIAREMGGGGYASTASATLIGLSMNEVEEKLIALLHRHIQPQPLALEMMTRPVITISPEISIAEANTTLTRYNITAVPAIRDGKVAGIISRQVVEKALYHDLGHLPVKSYMSTEVQSLGPDAELAEVQELIVEQRQRLVPILEQGELIGVVTRTDLLRKLVTSPENLPNDRQSGSKMPLPTKRKNLNNLIHETLSPEIITLLQEVGELADEIGFKAFAVGGFVRDLLLKTANLDLDIVVEGNGIAFAKKVAEHFKGKFFPHEKFLTATVTLPNDFKIDIATARLEYYESPAAMPMIQLSSIKLDLSRRDFSINAMALQINREQFGTLIDYFNSQSDLRNQVIRVLHNLSFVEDPSRIFRAIRFEKRMNFHIGPHTKGLIGNAVAMNLFGKSRDSRFLSELKIIFKEKDPLGPLVRLAEFGLFQYLWPDLRPNYRTDRRFCHGIRQTKAAIKKLYEIEPKAKIDKSVAFLLTIFHRSGPEEIQAFCNRFNEEEKICKKLLQTKQRCDALLPILYTPMAKSELHQHLQDLNYEDLLYICSVAKKSHIHKSVLDYLCQLRHIKPLLKGKDLMEMGYPRGPKFSEILNSLKRAKMDGLVSSRADEEELLQKNFPLSNLHC